MDYEEKVMYNKPVRNLKDIENMGFKVLTSKSGEPMEVFIGCSISDIARHLRMIYTELERLNNNVEILNRHHDEEGLIMSPMIGRIIQALHEIEAHTDNDILG